MSISGGNAHKEFADINYLQVLSGGFNESVFLFELKFNGEVD